VDKKMVKNNGKNFPNFYNSSINNFLKKLCKKSEEKIEKNSIKSGELNLENFSGFPTDIKVPLLVFSHGMQYIFEGNEYFVDGLRMSPPRIVELKAVFVLN
jgi:hypothetical protein